MADWLKWLLLGVLSIVFGVLALSHAVIFSLAVTTVVGALFLIAGVIQAVAGFWDEGVGSKILSILLGVLMAVLGYSFLSNPLAGTISLATLVTIFIAAGGVLRLAFAFQMKGTQVFWLMLVSGVLSLALAAYILFNPAVTVALLGILLGVELIINGAGLIALALWKRRHPGQAPAV